MSRQSSSVTPHGTTEKPTEKSECDDSENEKKNKISGISTKSQNDLDGILNVFSDLFRDPLTALDVSSQESTEQSENNDSENNTKNILGEISKSQNDLDDATNSFSELHCGDSPPVFDVSIKGSTEQSKYNDSENSKKDILGETCKKSQDDLDDLLNSFSELHCSDSLPALDVSSKDNVNKNTDKRTYLSAKKEAPKQPGIYKFYRKGDDMEAYIGHSKNIRQRLCSHAYGTQHVDKFLREEGLCVEVNTTVSPTKDEARILERTELITFKRRYGRLPEFNRRM